MANELMKFDCYGKAGLDEPIFTLRANDPLAPELVREWVKRYSESVRSSSLDKIEEALNCASLMDQWYKEHI